MRIRRLTAASLLAATLTVGVTSDLAGAQTQTTEADEGVVEEGREQVQEAVDGDDDGDGGRWGLLGLLGLLGLGGLAGLRRRRDTTTERTVGSERIR